MVRNDNTAHDGETSVEHCASEGRNADHARRCQEEANAALATQGDLAITGGNSHLIACNLDQEFYHVGDQEVEQTPSTNLAVAAHEFDKLQQTLEITKVRALLKAA